MAEFVGAVTRMAYERFPAYVTQGGLARQAECFIHDFLAPHVRLRQRLRPPLHPAVM